MAREARYERFAYWPDVHGTGARQLRRFLAEEDRPCFEPGALAKQSAAVQGLPALESLLYSGAKGLVGPTAPDAYRCKLALAVAGKHGRDRERRRCDGWSGETGWAALMRAPGADNPVYRTHEEAMTEIPEGDPHRASSRCATSACIRRWEKPGRGAGRPRALRSLRPVAGLSRRVRAGAEAFVDASGILSLRRTRRSGSPAPPTSSSAI